MRERVTVDDVQLDQHKVRYTLHEFEGMWQGQLRTIKVTEHRIELEPGSRPVRLPPHRASHKAREVEKTEVE